MFSRLALKLGRADAGWQFHRGSWLLPAALCLWTTLVAAFLAINLIPHQAALTETALAQSRITFKALEAAGPEFMAQQDHGLGGKFLGIEAHFTALESQRPESRPDPWERRALEKVAGHPDAEVFEALKIDGRSVLQTLRPLVIQAECLRCHGQGYKLGATRGGISLTVPLDPIEAARRPVLISTAVIYGLFWVLGIAAVILAVKSAQKGARLQAESEARFRRLFDGAPVAYHEIDRAGVIRRVNRAECALLGYESDELVGRPIWDFIAGQDQEASRRAIQKKIQEEQPLIPVRRRYVHRDGRELILEIHDSLARGADGLIEGLRSALLDVTERVRAEETLQKNEKMFRALTSSAMKAMIMMDSRGRVTLWNAAAERMFGYSAEEALGQQVHDLVVPADLRPLFHRNFPHFLETGRGSAIGKVTELRAMHKDGRESPIEIELTGVQQGTEWHAVAIIRDISELKQSQEEISQAHQQLSTMVKDLEERGRQNEIVRELNDFLQSCSSVEEAGPLIARSMTRLFPHSRGGLFLLSPSKSDLESAVTWGNNGWQGPRVIAPDACWALRRGRAYMVEDFRSDLICSHVRGSEPSPYTCIPLMANNEMLGMLHLACGSAGQADPHLGQIACMREVSTTLCEQLSMAVSNLKLRETLRAQSIRDPLTGLFNRRYMEESLLREAWRAGRQHYPIGIIMADIDHFKKFNDVHGHAAGDLVLSEFAAILRTHTRESDIPCRFGGEEFAIILPEAPLDDAIRRANQLRERIKGLKVSYLGQDIGPVTVSMGVSAYPQDGLKPEELLHAADAALYRAKQSGRDQVLAATGDLEVVGAS